jgi:uncharacterized protein (TIGR03086 family)
MRADERNAMTAEPVSQLATALEVTEQVIAGVHRDQWERPTPCTDWTVRDLVSHVVAGNNLFASVVAGQSPAAAQPVALSPDASPAQDFLTAYRNSAGALLGAFRQPGALEKTVTIPFGTVPGIAALHLRITEVLVHGWDLARATGQPAAFPADLAEQELAFSRGKLAELPPGRSPFAAPQPVAGDAAAIDRLAACLGRQVAPPAVSA